MTRLYPALLVPLVLPLPCACTGSRRTLPDDASGAEVSTVTVETSVKLQTLEGFGASVAWYAEWFTQHPNRATLAPILFRDLGIDILRLRNQYRIGGNTPDPSGLDIFHTAEASLGHAPRVLLTSWSPPDALKASGNAKCGPDDTNTTCTLLANADGSFPYDAFANYWFDSVRAYQAAGLDPYYISIQNEPDFRPNGWEGCMFNEVERDGLPGYDRALDAVSNRLEEANVPARILGAETAHLQNGGALRYASALDTTQLYGLAHHLYDGSSWNNPDNFSLSMTDLSAAYPSMPKFQTEFSPTKDGKPVQGGFEVAWLIHNSMAIEGASAYLHWELFWTDSGLVSLDNPWDRTSWMTADGYQIREPYYALRHFARYTDPGDLVVSSSASAGDILTTAYLSPDESRLTLVVLNTSAKTRTISLDLPGYAFASSLSYVTTSAAPWQIGDSLDPQTTNQFQIESQAILTVVVSQRPSPPE